MRSQKKPTHLSLKRRLYLNLYRQGVAVYSDDILEPSSLELAGCYLPAKGIELLRLLIELAEEGKVVIWREEHGFGFLSTKVWERELAGEKCLAFKMELESSRITVTAGTFGSVLSAVLVLALAPSKPGYQPLKHREEELDETPDYGD